jgi:hypothetical protein
MGLKIFVSHSSKYSDLAIKLKLSLQALETEAQLDIRISEDMAGAQDWQQWIEDNVRSADVFLLLYPHAAMEMGWCNYELGRFYDRKRPIVCIKNIDIPKPPPAFQAYQAYSANPAELYKFLKELFVLGVFTNGAPINADIGNPAAEYYSRARDVCNVLAAQFAEARVREHFYERRIVIALQNEGGQLSRDKSIIHGNSEGLALLGLSEDATTSWTNLKESLAANGEWLTELEATLPAVISGALPPVLPPYRSPSGIYLPIVVKAETADGMPRQLVVIFVSAGVDRLLPMLGWSFPRAMPPAFIYLVQLVRSMFRVRWDILEPRYQEARFKSPDATRCAEIARSVLHDFDQMEQDFDRDGSSGLSKFYGAFNTGLHDDVDGCSDEWIELTRRLRDGTVSKPEELAAILQGMMNNNTRWLKIASTQFSQTVAELH